MMRFVGLPSRGVSEVLLRILVADESQPAAAARLRTRTSQKCSMRQRTDCTAKRGRETGAKRIWFGERIHMIILCKSELILKISPDNSYLCYRPAQGVPVLLHLHHVHQGPLGRREDPRGVRPRVQGSPGRGICEWSHILVETLATMGLFTFFRRDVSSTER